ncbi:phosphate starvation-inducible protein PhoH [Rhizobium sp. AN5]|uniref:PhoH family protein n=1 Tax=Rhizobium sp. AN5 TaxID=1855304 RepID=UPI000BDC68AE|nr:PhoH family protein [Rhizobium sp. AN5]SOC90133.1 phosphate starvation-inducible protein PhoH [Rhizobium sp. AN5]
MSKPRKSVARQTRRDERARMRNDSKLIASADRSIPAAPTAARKEPVKPLTAGQKRYDAGFKQSSIVFGLGPAGTGKTWFAIQRAAEALKRGDIKKIYVTRPAIEVGEGMGFLPGELHEKFAPYLVPVKEAFVEALGFGYYEYCLKAGVIEPVPLAFIRGRTLRDAWVIADEMQNATKAEFQAFLTRIGENAKFVINGDVTQTDEKIGRNSGLSDAVNRIGNHSQVTVVNFLRSEIVRSGLCQDIVEAYES